MNKNIIVIIFLTLLLVSCQPSNSYVDTNEVSIIQTEYINESAYSYIVIDGMPCLIYEEDFVDEGYFGLSCDWSQWYGQVINDKISLPEEGR